MKNENNNDTTIPEIKFQMRLFSILLMTFAVLLFFALVSHTSKDEANLQIKFTE